MVYSIRHRNKRVSIIPWPPTEREREDEIRGEKRGVLEKKILAGVDGGEEFGPGVPWF